MPIKRYDLVVDEQRTPDGDWTKTTCMCESPEGKYVTFEDYEELNKKYKKIAKDKVTKEQVLIVLDCEAQDDDNRRVSAYRLISHIAELYRMTFTEVEVLVQEMLDAGELIYHTGGFISRPETKELIKCN